MICCNITIESFLAQSLTTIPFTGQRPIVSVIYLQPDGTFLQAGVMTQINVIGSQVVVDHGGPASGYVKLIQ